MESQKVIYLAGGCFWGVEAYFQSLKGVVDTEVGYANGDRKNPTYEDLIAHRASHAETVKVIYDEDVITLQKILEHFLRIVDPFAIDRQGHDVGVQYRSGVYFTDSGDGEAIRRYLDGESQKVHRPFAIEIEPLSNFYEAEKYHQDYLVKNPFGYCHVDLRKIKKDELK